MKRFQNPVLGSLLLLSMSLGTQGCTHPPTWLTQDPGSLKIESSTSTGVHRIRALHRSQYPGPYLIKDFQPIVGVTNKVQALANWGEPTYRSEDRLSRSQSWHYHIHDDFRNPKIVLVWGDSRLVAVTKDRRFRPEDIVYPGTRKRIHQEQTLRDEQISFKFPSQDKDLQNLEEILEIPHGCPCRHHDQGHDQ